MSGEQESALIQAALVAIASGQKAANAYGRPDLAGRLATKAASLADPSFHVLVVGEFKQGKSSLLNALVANSICPVDDDIATAVPTVVRWSQDRCAEVLFHGAETAGDEPPPLVRESIPVDDIPLYAAERAAGDLRQVHSVEIGLPSRFLNGGLILVDTPGVGGLGSRHGAVTAGAIPMAEAVIFVTDASQEFTAPELDFMQTTRKLCPNIVCLVTKTDFYPAWRKIRDLNAAHLKRLGIAAPIITTSAALHARAISTGDANMLTESGYPELSSFIRRDVLGSAVQLSVAAAASDLHDVLDQLCDHFRARKAVLKDPELAGALVGQLEAAQQRAEELKDRAARWQTTLSDGVQDLNTDVDHDLRQRFRQIAVDSESALENADPADVWGEFEPWLYNRATFDVLQNYEYLQQRARELSERVAEHFEIDFEGIRIDLNVIDPNSALSQVQARASLTAEKESAGMSLLTGARGGMGGMMMVGMLARPLGAVAVFSGVANVALPGIGIGLSLVMGRKMMRDDKARKLQALRVQAKAAQRKYMDDVTFRTSKESRDALRLIQRQIRDYFTTRADEQAKASHETLVAVKAAAQADNKDRARQLADVDAELGRLADLRTKVDALGPRTAGFASSGANL